MDAGTMFLIEFVVTTLAVCIINACFDKKWDALEKEEDAKKEAAPAATE